MTGLIITVYILWILSIISYGFSFYTIMLLIPTTMFALKKFAIYPKLFTLIAMEILFLFFSVTFKLIFNKFVLVKFLLLLLLRIIFLGICIYDEKVYVYHEEERGH